MRRRSFSYRPVAAYGLQPQLAPPVMNTTPLIDVMLVLLILFIVTIPMTSHKVPLDLPQGEGPAGEPVIHRLELARSGTLAWDGRPIADAELPALLATVRADPGAELHMNADGEAPYGRFDALLADVKRAGITRLGMIDNGRFAEAVR